MLIPSGILWALMAKAIDIPSCILVSADKYVAIPSGCHHYVLYDSLIIFNSLKLNLMSIFPSS